MHLKFQAFALLIFVPWLLSAQSQFERKADSIAGREKNFNGVILLAEKGVPVYLKAIGFRDYASKTPLQTTDVFELASVSKQFTAFIIMKLKEKGQLSYDDLAEKYLDIPYKGISIRHLLTHTSGLPDYQEIMDQHWDKSKVADNKDILEYLRKYSPPSLFTPGEKYNYSNTGYVLLASIAEKVSDQDFIKLCREWIFQPAKMSSTDIRSPKQKKRTKNFTTGHIYVDSLKRFVRADSFPSSDYTIWLGNRKGPGRVSSVAEDLLRWDQVLYSDQLIKQTTLAAAFQPMILNNADSSMYGFAWEIINDNVKGKVVLHTGDNPGYKTIIVRYLEQNKTIIILSNNAYPFITRLSKKLGDLMFAGY